MSYMVIREKYETFLIGMIILSDVLKSPLRRVNTFVHALFSPREFLLQSSNPVS